MKTFIHTIKFILTLVLVATVSLAIALPPETEYLGLIPQTGYSVTGPAQGYEDDGYWGTLPIGFSFDFFENTYTDFYVTSNGLLTFGSSTNQYSNSPIPTAGGANNYIAPFWDDIVVHATGDIMYQTIGTAPNRKLIVQYNNMAFYGSPILLGTFQVILYEGSNNIQTQYRSIVDLTSQRASGNSATIGLENSNGTAGVTYSYNTADQIHSEDAILFSPDGSGSYTIDDNTFYEGVLLVDTIARAGIPNLVSPANNSTIGTAGNFQWDATANAVSYYVLISQNSDLSNAIHTSADLTTLSYDYTLSLNQTYYWSVNAKNSAGVVTWSEIWMVQTSDTPPLVAVPQTFYLEQNDQGILTMVFTGGDELAKTATITSLPTEGALYQYDNANLGSQINTVPTDLTDASYRMFYLANGNYGNEAGSFNFEFTDASGTSAEETYTINVTPPGIPNFSSAAKDTDKVEITFDRNMADPIGKHLEFSVQDGGVDVTSTSCYLKPGDPTTIIVTVSPAMDTENSLTVAYTKGTVLAESGGALETFDFQIAGKLVQTISFSALSDKTYGDADFTLSSTASSGLDVTFSSSNSTIVSVSSTTASINNAGECVITATQSGNSNYAAVSFEVTQIVNKASAIAVLSDLSQDYTGSGVSPTTTTTPSGLDVIVEYDGSTTLPVDVGSYSVVVTINDANYTGSTTGTLVIGDFTSPLADVTDLATITEECSASPSAPTATDSVDGTITATTSTEFPVMESTTVTWTYEDSNGNTSSQTQEIVISDSTDPITPTLANVTGECSATASVPTTTDACAGTIAGTTSDDLTYATVGTHVITWNFDDGRGNSIDVNQNVIISDSTDPVEPTLANITGECSASASTPTTTDACAGTITGTTLDDLSYSTVGTHVITWNFDDGHGNSIDVDQSVIVSDSTDPIEPTLDNVTGECSVTASAPTTTDACAGTITGTTSDEVSYSTVGTHVITWNFDDGHGNTIDVNQNVIVNDLTDPVEPTLANVTGECSATASTPTTTDACAGTITGTTSDDLSYSTVGTHVITWNFNDGHGNAIDVDQNVVVSDSTDPEVPSLANVSGECSATASTPTTTDACAGLITGTTTDDLTYSTVGTHVITWNFDDGHGNTIDVNQNVIVNDSTNPAIPSLENVTGECSATASAPTTTDICAGNITGTTSDDLSYSTVGTHVITWNFDDGNGNSIDVEQNVIISDSTDPIEPTLDNVTGECSAIASAPTTTDACAGTITGTTSDELSYSTVGTHIITWNFDDGHGNTIDVNQNVIVTDSTDPVIPTLENVSGECSAIASAPTTSDACTGLITGTTSDDLSYSTVGTHVITWNFDDGHGNSIDVNQNVIVTDSTDPVIPTLENVSGECFASASIPTTIDDCAGTITGTTSDEMSYSTVGTHVITWNFNDGHGNTIDVNQNVIVTDSTTPLMPLLEDVIDDCSAIVDSPTTSDDCAGIVTGTTSDPVSYSEIGNYQITWNFDDGNGNDIDVVQNVNVLDLSAPIAPELEDAIGECFVSLDAPTANDACAGIITGTTSEATSYSELGSYAITWNFNDGNGNDIDVVQNVHVVDLTPPMAPTLEDLSGFCSVTAETPTANDACSGIITGTTSDALEYSSAGTHVIMWNFDDGNGNSVDVAQNVIVMDDTAPIIPTLEDVSGTCSAEASIPTTTDDCTGVVMGTTMDETSYSNPGTHVITWNFDDGNGNSVEATQNVIVIDDTPPVEPNLADVVGVCSATALVPFTMDACSGPITATTSDPIIYSVPGDYEITWNFDDGNGNDIDVVQTVVVADYSSPVIECPSDITVLANGPEQTYTALDDIIDLLSAEDNCGIEFISNDYNSSNTLNDAVFDIGLTTVTWTVTDYAGISSTCSIDINVESFVSVEEMLVHDKLAIYPNPNSGKFSIEFDSAYMGDVQVNIIDLNGRSIYDQVFNKESEGFSQNINLEEFSTGAYFVNVYTKEFNLRERIMITSNGN